MSYKFYKCAPTGNICRERIVSIEKLSKFHLIKNSSWCSYIGPRTKYTVNGGFGNIKFDVKRLSEYL